MVEVYVLCYIVSGVAAMMAFDEDLRIFTKGRGFMVEDGEDAILLAAFFTPIINLWILYLALGSIKDQRTTEALNDS